ncbi:MAG: amino acid adenylation domain-containing protein [Magnetococcales bacterium]|nr:amino acid adenylation domain-containing protein [Magnetococcales bacterium]
MTTDSRHPLASNQRDLWLDQLLRPESSHHVIGGVVDLPLRLDPELFHKALTNLTAEIDTLRLVPSISGEQPHQVLLVEPMPELEVQQFGAEESQQAEAWLAEVFSRPIALDGGLLFDFKLARIGENHSLFLMKYHHVIADGFTTSLVLRRWAVHYDHLTQGAEIPPLKNRTYLEHLDADKRYRQSAAYQRDRTFWQQEFPTAVPTLFPHAPPRPAVSQTLSLPLKRSHYDALNRWAQPYKGTAYHLILGVLALLFMERSQPGEMVVGIPVHHRSGRFRNTPGMLVDINPLRLRWEPDHSFAQLLIETIQSMRGSFRHKRFPVGEIARIAGIKGARQRLFDIILTHDRWDLNVTFNGVAATAARRFPGVLSHALLVTILENFPDQDLELIFEFNGDLFQPEEMALSVQRVEYFLDEVLRDPDQPLRLFPWMPPAERERVLSGFNPPLPPDEPWRAVHHTFETIAAEHPQAVAVRGRFGTLRYDQLNQAVNRLAHHLIGRDVAPGTIVAISLPRSPEMIVAVLAILKTGGGYLPLDPDQPTERLGSILDESRIGILITTSKLSETLVTTDRIGITLDSMADLALYQSGSEENPRITPEDMNSLAYVIHTSGSTGTPKGVMVGHRALAYRIAWMARTFEVGRDDRVLQFFRLAFDPSAHEIFLPLTTGASLVLTDPGRQPAAALIKIMTEHAVTFASVVPSLLEDLLTQAEGRDLSNLRILTSGGEALTAELAARVRQELTCRMINFYGPTEATILASWWEGDPQQESGTLPLGVPLSETSLHVLDQTGEPLPIGQEGEIHIGGDALALGYLNQPEQTAECFVADPFRTVDGATLYRTGDRGCWRSDGQLLFRGRGDHQIKLRGYRIELAEIETKLCQHSAVKEAVVRLRRSEQGGDYLTAWITPISGQKTTPEALRRFLSQRLADYMIPSTILTLETMPLSENGKIDDKRLPSPECSVVEHDQGMIPPRSSQERTLMSLWQSVLGHGSFGIHDDFFMLGGDSLSAMSLLAAVEKHYDQRLPLDTLFTNPTIHGMATALSQHQGGLQSDVVKSPRYVADRVARRVSCIALTPQQQGVTQNPPLFCVASSLRDRRRLGRVAEAMGTRQPFYLLQPPEHWPDGGVPDMEILAEGYRLLLEEQLQGDKPFRIGGYSVGGSVALALGRQLLDHNRDPGPPILLDTIYPTLVGTYLSGYRLLGRLVAGLTWRLPYAHRFGDAGLQLQLTALLHAPQRPYPGPVVLIQGALVSGFTWRIFGRARRLFPQGLTSRKVGGGHGGMTRGRFLGRLATTLDEVIRRSDR